MNVDEVIEEFIEADRALRDLIEALEEVRSSRSKLDAARSELGEARTEALEYLEKKRQEIAEDIEQMDARTTSQVERTVESVEGALREASELAERRLNAAIDSLTDASRRLQGVADPLKDCAQQLTDVASTWRTVRPDELHDGIAELRRSGRRQRTFLVVLVALAVLNLAGVITAVVS